MKILYIITKSEAGGAQTHIYQLAKYMTEQGNRVGVMSYPGGWLEEKVKRLGAKFYPNIYFSNTLHSIKWLKAKKEIKKALEDFKPDLVSCHSTMAGFLGRLVIKNKIPTIFTAHGWGFTLGTPFWRKYLVIFAEKIAAKFSSMIICVSDFDRNLSLKYKIASSDKVVTIHNGVEIQKDVDLSKKDFNYPLKIIFVGRLAEPKDPLLLLGAYNSLSGGDKEKSEILIIGEGEKRKELEDFIFKNKLDDKVKLLGELEREEVFEVLKNSDIFVLPSKWEGFPRSVLEAMSCGLPVIASNVGGIKEAVDNCGILVKRGDKEGIKNAFEKLLKNPPLIREMGEKAREKAKEEFSLEKMIGGTEEIYRIILGG